MPSLRLTSLVSCGLAVGLASVSGPAWAGGTIRHYDIDVEIAAGTSTLRATAALTIQAPEGGLREIELLLNHGLAVRSLTSDAGVKSFRFDRDEPSTNRYAPKAAPLRIELADPVAAGHDVVVRLRYEGTIDPDPYLTNVVTPEWVELASYAAWYPQQPGSGGYTYRLGVKADPGYAVAGPGVLAAAKNGWTLTQDDPSWDIVLVAGRGLRAQHVADGGLDMDVWHVADSPIAPQAASFARDVGRMMTTFRGWYGAVPTKKLAIVFAERKSGGGYLRGGFMSLLFDSDYRGLVQYAAHEMAHSWWGRADANTWQDWLNESFAEYSALMLVRDWHGRAAWSEILGRYEREAQQAKAIWGLDRSDRSAQATLYRKGPVLLSRLEARVGEPAFRQLLAALVSRQVRTTEQYLATLEELTSAAVRQSFEQELKG